MRYVGLTDEARIHRRTPAENVSSILIEGTRAEKANVQATGADSADGFVAGRDGSIWLAQNSATEAGRRWIVLDGDGEPIWTVVLPLELTLRAADPSMIWGAEQDDLGVEYIVLYGVRFPD